MSLLQYTRFIIVGAFVAGVTVGCRELIGRFMLSDTPVLYSVSIVMAYAIGITLSFLLNRRFTFRRTEANDNLQRFARFTVIAVIGMLTTWLLSLALRYGLPLDKLLGEFAAGIAFAAAALLSSSITYPLNARRVFANPQASLGEVASPPRA